MKHNTFPRQFLRLFCCLYTFIKKKYSVFSTFYTHSIYIFFIIKRKKYPVNTHINDIKTNTQTKPKKKKKKLYAIAETLWPYVQSKTHFIFSRTTSVSIRAAWLYFLIQSIIIKLNLIIIDQSKLDLSFRITIHW